MLRNYFLAAFRNFSRNRGYALINVFGLSIGLACAILITLYVKDELSFDRFHNKGKQVFRVVRKLVNPDGSFVAGDGYTGLPQGPQFAASIPEIKGFVRLQNGQIDLKTAGEIQSQSLLYVDSNFLSVFTFPLISGNPATALRQPNGVVISADFAKRQFGTYQALGKTIEISSGDRFEPHVVTAVTKNSPLNSTIKFQMLMPLQSNPADEAKSDAWMNSFLHSFVVLKPGADPQVVEEKMRRVFETRGREAMKTALEKYDIRWHPEFLLQPLTEMHLSKDYQPIDGLSDASNPVYSYILSGMALFILIIACINFINLTVARSGKRSKEIGIRKVIGGKRRQLITQFLGETFLLCFAAFLLALLLVQLALPLFNQLANKSLALSYLLDWKLISGFAALYVATSLLSGFYPAVLLSGFNPVQTLYNKLVLGSRNYLQKSLVVLQFTLSAFLIAITLVIFSQFRFMTHINLGYDDSNLVVVNQWGLTKAQASLFKTDLASDPNILGITTKDMGYDNETVKTDDQTKIGFVRESIDPQYLGLMKILVIAGRDFREDLASDSIQSIIINETFARQAGWKDPVGKQILLTTNGEERFTVIGVVKDYHFQALNEVIKAQVFTLKPGRVLGNLLVKIRPGSETASLASINKAFRTAFPLSPFSYFFKSQENLNNYEAESNWRQIMLFSAIITIFISCVGLFGLSVLSAEARLKEIGIRKVLGASARLITVILSKDFLKLVTIALLIALPVSWFAGNHWLENYPYHVSLNALPFAAVALSVIGIAMITVSFQVIRAAVSSPVKSLRNG